MTYSLIDKMALIKVLANFFAFFFKKKVQILLYTQFGFLLIISHDTTYIHVGDVLKLRSHSFSNFVIFLPSVGSLEGKLSSVIPSLVTHEQTISYLSSDLRLRVTDL